MFSYYDDKLAALRLKRVYELATPRVRQYLKAEIKHVLGHIVPNDTVLELGCGFGRVLAPLAANTNFVIGIDMSQQSLQLARKELQGLSNIGLARMNAANLGCCDRKFEVVVCVQNGISAFHVNKRRLIEGAVRVTKPGGIVLFSSYADQFWEDRLNWFQIQSDAGLLGEIDYEKTHNGVIACKDGFTASTVGPNEFAKLCDGLDVDVDFDEVDESSVFCRIRRR